MMGKREMPGERFVMIPHELIQSAAWRTLKARDVWALVHLIDGYIAKDTYKLSGPSVRWACTWGALRRGLDNLIAGGFIDIVRKGGMGKGNPDVYKLSDRWKARSAALMLDESQRETQGKLGEAPPRSSATRHLKQFNLPFKRQRPKSGRPSLETDKHREKDEKKGRR